MGVPYPSVEVRLGEDGEVLARGPSVFGGYWGAVPTPIDDDGWFHTGDLGAWDGDALRLVGRKKELIALAGGKKVAPAPIEGAFEGPGQLVLFGEGRRRLVGLVFTDQEVEFGPFVDRLNRALPRHERIRRFAVVDEPPTVDNGLLTPSLKLRRHVVRERYEEQIESLFEDAVLGHPSASQPRSAAS